MSQDRLNEINGIKPNKVIKDGEEFTVTSESKSKAKYKIKRLNEDISCTCPAWRNQKKLVNSRTCKHLRSTFGDKYEDARVALMESETQSYPSGKQSSKPKKRKRDDDEENEVKDEEASSTPVDPNDPLSSINDTKPKVYIVDGEEREIESQTSSTKYKIKRTADHYYCTCPAWRMQKDAPVNARSCKHLRSILGDAYEDARIQLMNPGATTSTSPTKSKAPASKKAKKAAPSLLLAVKWDLDGTADPTGWWCSEKLDGVRAYFDGKAFTSRNGNTYAVPQDLIDELPKDVTLDGEQLFGGRGAFNDTVSIVRSSTSPKWAEGKVSHLVFDMPSCGDIPFEERMAKIEDCFGDNGTNQSDFVKIVEQTEVRNKKHVVDMLSEVTSAGGEGLMLRKPKSKYEGKRSNTLQKIKTFHDAEARVVGYVSGKGKYKGVTGALKCEMASGKNFSVGSGLSDALRTKPPKIGTIVTYRFQELTLDKVPRFPTFVGEAIDKDEPSDFQMTENLEDNEEEE